MSSNFYIFEDSFYQNSSPEMVSPDGDLFFPDPFFPFWDSTTIDVPQEVSNSQNTQTPLHDFNTFDDFSSNILSSSPPSHQLENLTLYQSTHFQPVPNTSNSAASSCFANGYENFSGLDGLEVKTEEYQVGFDCSYNHQSFMPHSYSGVEENVGRFMQKSYSSNSFDGKPEFFFQPGFDPLMESPGYQNHAFGSPENGFLPSHMRRVCSTGDLQNIRISQTTQRSISSPLSAESSVTEEANYKVGRYSAEERKERISKYRAKRNQRNFNKTIKYACRKTLADNRLRIRGRFARNEEFSEIPKPTGSARDEDGDEQWEFDGLHEEEDDGGAVRGMEAFVSSYDYQSQFQNYNFGY